MPSGKRSARGDRRIKGRRVEDPEITTSLQPFFMPCCGSYRAKIISFLTLSMMVSEG